MPIYAFACTDCGPFEVLRPVAQAAAEASCPACHSNAQRVFTAPGLGRLDTSLRRALDMEERSGHEPDVAVKKRGRPIPHRHAPAEPWVLGH
jgi:putative FmdB family regulatory protein